MCAASGSATLLHPSASTLHPTASSVTTPAHSVASCSSLPPQHFNPYMPRPLPFPFTSSLLHLSPHKPAPRFPITLVAGPDARLHGGMCAVFQPPCCPSKPTPHCRMLVCAHRGVLLCKGRRGAAGPTAGWRPCGCVPCEAGTHHRAHAWPHPP